MAPDLHRVCSPSPGDCGTNGLQEAPPLGHQTPLFAHTQRALLWDKCKNFSSTSLRAVIVSSLLCSQSCLKDSEHWNTPVLLFFDVWTAFIFRECCFPAIHQVTSSCAAEVWGDLMVLKGAGNGLVLLFWSFALAPRTALGCGVAIFIQDCGCCWLCWWCFSEDVKPLSSLTASS